MLREPRRLLLVTLACFAGLVVTGVLAYLVPVTRAGDSATLLGFTSLNRPRVTPLLAHVAHLCDPASYALIGLGLAAVALARRRARLAGLVVGLLLATGWTTQSLKPLLASPRYDEWLGSGQISAASWPSGHATAAMTLALCAVLVSPARLRPVVAVLGAAFAVAVSYSILALGWHFPSDVFGGFLVAATWVALGLAGLAALEQRRPSRATHADPLARRIDVVAPIGLGVVAVGLGGLVALARPAQAERFAVDHTVFMVGAVGIAFLAVLLALGFARAVRSPVAVSAPRRAATAAPRRRWHRATG